MNNLDFQRAYEEQNRKEYITNATIASVIQIPLNLSCSIMDYFMYPGKAQLFLKARILSAFLVGFAWFWFKFRKGHSRRQFGIMWIMSPLLMILWLIYSADDRYSPYYAGLNIILLGMALLTPWAYLQNLLVTIFVLVMYVVICIAMKSPQPTGYLINNTTFLFLTSAIVVTASAASARQRLREFTLRYELDKNREALQDSLVQLKGNEAQLVHSEKLASLGRMSAGMIHEINNPLNFTTTALFTLRKKGKFLPSEQQKDFAETLKDVEEGVGRVKTIVSDLRVFTRPDSENCDEVFVVEAVTAALRFLNFERKDEVQIEQELSPDLKIWVNKNKLIHVLGNLLQNSFDALKTKTFTDERPTIRITGREENGVNILTVRDNGPGIPEAHLQKIFDPFFTTKDVGAGMGLGLSICYRLVEEAQGKISVKTETGKFCEFTLEFPARKTQTTAA